MPLYDVVIDLNKVMKLPDRYSGIATVQVEADDREDAIAKAAAGMAMIIARGADAKKVEST
jgi:hypothetical protein